jgi:hypothetical protein
MAKTVDINLIINTAGSEKTLDQAKQNLSDINGLVTKLGTNSETALGGKLNDALQKTTQNITKLTNELQETGNELENNFNRGKDAAEGFSQTSITSLGKLRRELATLNNDLESVEKGSRDFEILTNKIKGTEQAIRRSEGAFGDAADKLKTLSGSGVEKANSSFSLLREGITNLDFGKLKIGIQGVGGSFKALGSAIAASGIGALALAITYIITNFDELSKSGGLVGKVLTAIGDTVKTIINGFEQLADKLGLIDLDEQKQSEARQARAKKFIEDEQNKRAAVADRYNKEIALLKAAGKDTDELELKSLKAQKAVVDSQLARIKALQETTQVFDAILAPLIKKLTKEQEDAAQAVAVKEAEIGKKRSDNEVKRQQELRDLKLKYTEETLQQQLVREEKAELDKAKKLGASETILQSIRDSFSKKRQDDLLKQANEILDADAAARKTAEEESEKDQKEARDARVKRVLEANKSLNEQIALQNQEALDAANLKLLEDPTSIDAQIEFAKAQRDIILENTELTEAERQKIINDSEDKINALKQQKIQQGFDIAKAGLNALSSLNDLVSTLESKRLKKGEKLSIDVQKKQFNRGKALAVANAGISTAEAIIKSLANPGGPAGVALSIFAGVTGAASIASILAKQFQPDSPTASGGNTPDVGNPNLGGDQTFAPTPSIANQQIGAIDQNGFKVFVTETDITRVINKVDVIESQSKFG